MPGILAITPKRCGPADLKDAEPGFTLGMEELFQEWAGIVRKIGETPSAAEYMLHSQHSLTPLRKRFRYWNDVPAGMVQYAVENGLEEQWADVLEVARKYRREGRTGGWRRTPGSLCSNPRILNDRPVYGAPFLRTRPELCAGE